MRKTSATPLPPGPGRRYTLPRKSPSGKLGMGASSNPHTPATAPEAALYECSSQRCLRRRPEDGCDELLGRREWLQLPQVCLVLALAATAATRAPKEIPSQEETGSREDIVRIRRIPRSHNRGHSRMTGFVAIAAEISGVDVSPGSVRSGGTRTATRIQPSSGKIRSRASSH